MKSRYFTQQRTPVYFSVQGKECLAFHARIPALKGEVFSRTSDKSQLIELELIPIEVQAVIEHYSDFENHGLLSTPGAEM